MALKNCPECKAQISTDAQICPRCGAKSITQKIEDFSKACISLGALLLALVILYILATIIL